MPDVTHCERCGRDAVVPTKVRRFHGALVVLGFVLMVVGAGGLVIGGITKYGGDLAVQASERSPGEVRRDLEGAGVPEPLIAKTMGETDERVMPGDLEGLDREQLEAVQRAQLAALTDEFDPGLMQKAGLYVLIASALGLVLGWVLRSKKEALRCAACGAVRGEVRVGQDVA